MTNTTNTIQIAQVADGNLAQVGMGGILKVVGRDAEGVKVQANGVEAVLPADFPVCPAVRVAWDTGALRAGLVGGRARAIDLLAAKLFSAGGPCGSREAGRRVAEFQSEAAVGVDVAVGIHALLDQVGALVAVDGAAPEVVADIRRRAGLDRVAGEAVVLVHGEILQIASAPFRTFQAWTLRGSDEESNATARPEYRRDFDAEFAQATARGDETTAIMERAGVLSSDPKGADLRIDRVVRVGDLVEIEGARFVLVARWGRFEIRAA